MATGPAYHLDDPELVRALSEMVQRIPHTLNDWERDFAASLPAQFTRSGWLSWKQRRTARRIIDRVMTALAGIHNRPDLLATPPPPPAPVYAPPRLVVPPSPLTPEEIAAKLSASQKAALLILADGLEHRTATSNTGDRPAGYSVRILFRRGLADARLDSRGHGQLATITELGKRVAATLKPPKEPAANGD